MGLFASKGKAPRGGHPMAILGSGLRLQSRLDPDGCLQNLDAVLRRYRTPEYVHLDSFVDAGFEWRWSKGAPTRVLSFKDRNDASTFLAIWPEERFTMMGLFPLGSGDERLMQAPILHHLRDQGGALLRAGFIRPGLLALREPVVSADYCESMLSVGGYPATPKNLARAYEMMRKQFVLRSCQFIQTRDAAAAEKFRIAHRSPVALQAIMRDLAAWDSDFLPYIQSIPARMKALMLEPLTLEKSPFWLELDR
jgi:hypothetical protein